MSAAIRACVEYVLAHPEAWTIFEAPFNTVDTRSPAQIAAYEQYEVEAAKFDMNSIVR